MSPQSSRLTNYIAFSRQDGSTPQIGHLDHAQQTIQPLAFLSGTPVENLYQVIEVGTKNITASIDPPIPLKDVKVLPPISGRDVLAVGKNYMEHAKEFNSSGYDSSDKVDKPSHPVIFTKRATSIIADGEEILLHKGFTESADYEGEIGIIVGKAGFRVSEADAWDYVWGYTIINDLTARERQRDHKQFYIGKSPDTFCPMGPVAVPKEDLPKTLRIRTHVNGELRQDATTEDLIFSIPHLISTLSAGTTLQPGDVLATGTVGDAFTAHIFDFEGHGLSPTHPLSTITFESLVADLLGIFEVAGVSAQSPAVLVGHSMGSIISAKFAIEHQSLVKKLVLMGPPPFPLPGMIVKTLSATIAKVRSEGMDIILKSPSGLSDHTIKTNPLAAAAVRLGFLGQDPEGYAKATSALANATEGLALEKLAVETLVISGQYEAVSPEIRQKAYVEKISKAKQIVLPDVGHWHVFEDVQGVVHSLQDFLDQAKTDLNAVAEEYDYIVIGGGTSGLVVANRLSENPAKTVLVVEYGDFPNTINVTVPYFTTYDQSARLYNVTSVPQVHLGNRTSRLRIGATVGGGSSVNGMAWDRGSVADYDAWEALGNPGWGWNNMLKYFRKSSTFAPPSQEYVDKYGYDWNRDAYGNGPIQVGFPSWQWPAAAAGAVNTPRILQLSGIGPSKLLKGLGINITVDSPGVGANFQDHPSVFMVYDFANDTSVNPTLMNNATFYNQSWAEYLANKTGPHSHAWGNKVVFTSLRDLDSSNYQNIADALSQQEPLQYLPQVYAENPALVKGFEQQRDALKKQFLNPKAGVVEITFGGAESVPVALQKPLSRGTIAINTTNPDPSIAPLVDFNTMSNPIDSLILIRAVAKARAFMSSPSVKSLAAVEMMPGPGAASDAEIEAIMRQSWVSSSFDHPAGTAAMMPKEWGGVVDSKLRVYGVKGLWVVDTSVMPILPAAHTQATVYAVAEYAADIIKANGNMTAV
ncbi:Dehydrogenase xptC [Colletotrichum sp. SAR11_239]|nr:Dehydrogenase xptC [Colletotrichum sp. SAR11_239]